MIYLDNAATTFPKPATVRRESSAAFSYGANPGRSGHNLSLKASEAIYNCRNKISQLFNFDKPENVILMPSCTMALNTVIKGVLRRGDHVVISSMEHNSVVRPLEKLAASGFIEYSVAQVFEDNVDRTVNSFRMAIRDNTKLVICIHASNVFGIKLPVSQIAALCRYYGILFCIDTAQTAGIVDIDVNKIGADFICAPGHKGLYGPMGTGFLIINSKTIPDSLCEGGTGSGSLNFTQPSILPDKFESGTLNLSGFAGLAAGVDFVRRRGIDNLYNQEMGIVSKLYDRLSTIKGVKLYTKKPTVDAYVPLLSFNIDGFDSNTVAQILDDKFGIAVRAGLHCSPLAHRHYGTENQGTVRVCPSAFTVGNDVNVLTNAVIQIVNKKIQQ